MPKNKALISIFFLIITILLALLYKNAFTAYFFQDDWYTLTISKVDNLVDVVKFFIPDPKVIYYRPLGMQLPFFLLQKIFGLNPIPFHLLTFASLLINSYLSYLLIKILTKRDSSALLVAFLYSTSAIHFIPLYWTSTYAFVLSTSFYLLSFIFYLKNYNFLSLSLFILGLFTNELVITLPLVLFAYELILAKKNFKKIIPFGLVSLFYLGLRLFLFNPPTIGDYQLAAGIELVHNLKAYFLWSFNLPDEIKAQFINFIELNPQFLRDFPIFTSIFIITLLLNLIIFTLAAFKNLKFLLFGLSWFTIGLAPVIFFPKHSFSYYLEISLIGLLLPYGLFIRRFNLFTLLLAVFLINWVISSFNTIKFNELVHWAPQRSKLSKKLVEQIYKKFPNKPVDKKIYIYNSSENKLALNNQDALHILFNDADLKTIYTLETTGNKKLIY